MGPQVAHAARNWLRFSPAHSIRRAASMACGHVPMFQFATYVRIQVNRGQQGKIAIGNSAMAAASGNIAGSALIELWPNWDGSVDNGRSDTWTMNDPKRLNTIDLSKIYILPENAGERAVITAYQLV